MVWQVCRVRMHSGMLSTTSQQAFRCKCRRFAWGYDELVTTPKLEHGRDWIGLQVRWLAAGFLAPGGQAAAALAHAQHMSGMLAHLGFKSVAVGMQRSWPG